MAGTPEGWLKAKAKMIERMGGEEAFKAHRREMALKAQESWKKNGRKPRGFAFDKDLAREAGARGGRISRRRSMKEVIDE
jgi:general stress protein YciG